MSGDNELEGKSQGVRSDRRISQELVRQGVICQGVICHQGYKSAGKINRREKSQGKIRQSLKSWRVTQ